MRRDVADAVSEPPKDSVHHVINLDDQTWEENFKGQWSATPSYVYRRHLLDDAPKSARKVYESLLERANHHTCIARFESWNELAVLSDIHRGDVTRAIDWLIANYLIVKFGRSCFRIIRSETIHTQLSLHHTAYKEEARVKRFQEKSSRRARPRLSKLFGLGARAPAQPGARAPAQPGRARPRLEARPSLHPNSDQKRDQKVDHQHQGSPPALPLTEVRASTEVKNPPTADDDDSEKDCARKVEILLRAQDSTGRGMKKEVALDIARSGDGHATPIAGYEKLLDLVPKKYTVAAGAWWRSMLPKWEVAGPDEAGQRIDEHQARAATRPRVDEGERQRQVMQFIATLDDATLKQRWDEALKRSHFSKAMLDNLRFYSLDFMRRCYSAGASAIFEHFGPGAIDADGGEEA